MLSGTLYYALAVNRIFEAYPTGAIGEGSRAQPGIPATSPHPSREKTRRRGVSPAWPSDSDVKVSGQWRLRLSFEWR